MLRTGKLPRELRIALVGTCLLLGVIQCAAAERGVHGRVLGLNANGEPTGTVPGAKVTLYGLSGAAVAETETGQGGYYRLDVAPGRYTFRVTAAGYKDEDEGRGIALQLSDGYAVFNFSLIKGENDPNRKRPDIPTTGVGTLSGRAAFVHEGVREGIPEATISLRGPNGARMLMQVVSRGVDRSSWQSTGQYSVSLAEGNWRASVQAEGFETLVEQTPIKIVADQQATHDFILKKKLPPEVRNQGIKVRVSSNFLLSGSESPPDHHVYVYIVSMDDPTQLGDPVPGDGSGWRTRELPVGKYRAVVVADGCKPDWSETVDVFRGKYTLVDLTLEKETGQMQVSPPPKLVLDAAVFEAVGRGMAKRPLADVDVLLRGRNETLDDAPRATTDAEGKVQFEVPTAGTYAVLAQKKGYAPGGARITMKETETNQTEITLRRQTSDVGPVTFSGYVVREDASASSGIVGLPGSKLRWIRLGDPSAKVAEAVAQASGRFEIEIPEGRYQFDVLPPPGTQNKLMGASEKMAITSNMPKKYFMLDLLGTRPDDDVEDMARPTKVEVKGLVVTESEGRFWAVPGALLTWSRGAGERLPAVTSQARGQISISLEPGEYDVAIRAPEGFNDGKERVQVKPGMPTHYFVLSRSTSGNGMPNDLVKLDLRVLEAGTNRSPRPLLGAMVTIVENDRPVARATADAQGRVSFRLPPKSYEIQTTHSGFESDRGIIQLTADDIRRDIYLKRRGGSADMSVATLSVQVGGVNSQGGNRVEYLPGAQVSITQNRRTVATGTTDRNGVFTARLGPGTYGITAGRTGYDTGRDSVTLTTANVSRRILLKSSGMTQSPKATLKIQVGGKNPQGGNQVVVLKGASVMVKQNGRSMASGATGGDGVFSAQLPPGTYEIEVNHADYYAGKENVALSSGTSSRRMLLNPKRRIQ